MHGDHQNRLEEIRARRENAEFLSHAISDIQFLLAEVDRLNAIISPNIATPALTGDRIYRCINCGHLESEHVDGKQCNKCVPCGSFVPNTRPTDTEAWKARHSELTNLPKEK